MFFKILRILAILSSLFCGIMIFANLGEPECLYYLFSCISSIIFTIILSKLIYLSDCVDEFDLQTTKQEERIVTLEKQISELKNFDKKDS